VEELIIKKNNFKNIFFPRWAIVIDPYYTINGKFEY
jgi:hypothetical protein